MQTKNQPPVDRSAISRGDTHALFAALGGVKAVAIATGSTEKAVRAWHGIGVPYKHFDVVRAMARERGFDLTGDDLKATKPVAARPERARPSKRAA